MWLKGTRVKADGSQKCKDKFSKTSTTMNLKLPAEHFQPMPLQQQENSISKHFSFIHIVSGQKVFQSKASKVLKF